MKKFFQSPWLAVACFFTFVSVIGPALMSAPSDLAVLLNIVLACLLGVWLYRTFSRLAQNAKRSNPDSTTPKE